MCAKANRPVARAPLCCKATHTRPVRHHTNCEEFLTYEKRFPSLLLACPKESDRKTPSRRLSAEKYHGLMNDMAQSTAKYWKQISRAKILQMDTLSWTRTYIRNNPQRDKSSSPIHTDTTHDQNGRLAIAAHEASSLLSSLAIITYVGKSTFIFLFTVISDGRYADSARFADWPTRRDTRPRVAARPAIQWPCRR